MKEKNKWSIINGSNKMKKTKPNKCAMCGQPAIYVLKKTGELLCEKCMGANEQIRRSKER